MFGLCLVAVLLAPLCVPVIFNSGGVTAACLLLAGPLVALPSWRLAWLQPKPLSSSARRQEVPQIDQKLPCCAIALPITSPSGHQRKENLLPRGGCKCSFQASRRGRSRRGAGVPEGNSVPRFLLCALAGSPVAPVPGAGREMNVPMCSSPWLGTAPVEQTAEPNVPSAIPYCWLGVWAEGWPWHVLVCLWLWRWFFFSGGVCPSPAPGECRTCCSAWLCWPHG